MTKPDSLKRDYHYSVDHRTFPHSFYFYDIDNMEFNKHAEPVCLIEIKHPNIREINLSDFQIQCQQKVANHLQIPYRIVVAYYYDEEGFILDATDPKDKQINKSQYFVIDPNLRTGSLISKREYIKCLGQWRQEDLSEEILNQYSTWTNDQEWVPKIL